MKSKIKVALIGKMRSGKDTVGEWLIDDYDFKKYAFATGIGEIIDKYFPNARAEGKPRHHYQFIGQQLRELDPMVWINYIYKTIEHDDYHRIVITDTRQENEVNSLKENGFVIIKVVADEEVRIQRIIDSGDKFNIHDLQHETEAFSEIVDADYTIVNNGTLTELKMEVETIINKLINE